MSAIRLAQVAVSVNPGDVLVGPDDAESTVSNGPSLAVDVLDTRELTSSVRRQADTPSNHGAISPISAPLPPVPLLTYVDLQPAGARRPVPIQVVSPYDLSKDTGVCLPAIDTTRAHARVADVRFHCLTPGQLPTLPRSKKTTKLKVSNHPPDLNTATHQREGAASAIDVLLSIEGQDLKLPPPRTRTGARREYEKSRHRPNAVRVASELGFPPSRFHGDDIRSLEESLKKLLLCQSMGVIIQITRRRGDSGGLAQPVFHCSRCLKHWADYGRLPPNCNEPEARVSGPSFAITSRSQEILQKFTRLTPVDKQCFLEAIQTLTIPPPRGENIPCPSVSHTCDKVWMPGTGHVKMSVTGMGDEADKTVRTTQSQPVQVASESDSTISMNRDPTPDRPQDTAVLPNAVSQSLKLRRNREGAKYSSREDEHDRRRNREDNDSIDIGDAKGDPDSRPVQTGTEPCLFGSTNDTKRDLTNSVAEQASSISSIHVVDLDKGLSPQKCDAAVATKLVEDNQELVGDQACYSNCVSPRTDDPWSNETRLGEGVPNSHKQRNEEESLLPANEFPVDDEIGLPEEHLMNISPNVMDDERLKENGGGISNTHNTQTCEVDRDMISKGDAFQDREYLSEEEKPAHAISKVTVTRNGLLQNLSNGTASFNNSAGADDAKSNKSFERLINDAEDPDKREQSATPERQEAKSARSSLCRHGNGDSEQPAGQERANGRKIPSSTQHLGKGSALEKNRRESSVSYMGVMQDSEENQNRGTSSSAEEGATSRGSHWNIGRGNMSASRDQMAAPIRNTAVRNVTGKPDTRPGNLERHVFATPRETLAQTNALGMVPKPSGEGLANDTTKQSQDRRYLTQDSGSNASAPRRESNAAATALPPLNAMPRQLPSMGVHDTEQRSKARDRKRSLGLPRTDHALQEFVDRQQGQEDVPIAREIDEEQRYTSRPGKRQPVPREREEGESKGKILPRQLTERSQKIDKQKAQDDIAEQLVTKQKGEKLSPELTDRFLPSIASTKGELMSKEISDQQELRERETKSPQMKSLFSQFDNFELSLSPPPAGSLPPVSTDKSFRMTYSTLPKTFDWDTPRQPPLKSRQTPSPPHMGLAGNLNQQMTDELLDAKLMKQSTVVRHSSRDFYDKSARTPSRASGKRTGVYPSASESSQESSPAESVWESVSEVWRRHTSELQKLERMVALNFLPLTSAFTFSVFEIPPQYLAHNRSLREQAMHLRTLKKPKKIVMKFASKEQRQAAMRPPMIRRPVKPVK
ncbi:uncharacterized protein LOC119736372 [Patiria miniata]|uniref:Uncharacterized protein n=1 Tax=Patiria miniata TaxID=46514 RepID=A0A914ARP0_PATMI|nr:uncharacterized protein LOC119736372 [Patiria miniata]